MTPIEKNVFKYIPAVIISTIVAFGLIYFWIHYNIEKKYDIIFSPSIDAIIQSNWIVILHLSSAFVALFIGIIVLFKPKGRGLHRLLGWSWVAAMATTTISSIWIREINPGGFSYIHLLTGWTAVSLPMAVAAVRWRKNIESHAHAMTWTFTGALIVAGLFTLLPGRTLWDVFFDIIPAAK